MPCAEWLSGQAVQPAVGKAGHGRDGGVGEREYLAVLVTVVVGKQAARKWVSRRCRAGRAVLGGRAARPK